MPYRLRKAPNRDLYWVVTVATGEKHSKDPIPREKAEAQKRVLEDAMEGEGVTHRSKVIKKLGLKDEGHSLAELAKASGVSRKVLQEVYNRGIGAYKTNPRSVRMKGSFKKNVDAPLAKKLSKEQWAMARVYSFLDGNPKHDEDLRGGGPMPGRGDLQVAAEGAYRGAPQNIGTLVKVRETPTLVFYRDRHQNTMVVAIRGTVPTDPKDLVADAAIVVGQLERTPRFQNDLRLLKEVQAQYPPSQFDWYGVGHSLGGAILDLFLKSNLLKRGVSYNPAVQPQSLVGDTKRNERIYQEGDPLYQLIGRFTNPEVRPGKKKPSFWGNLPYVGPAIDYLQEHGLGNFVGGAKPHGEFEKQLHEVGIVPSDYLRLARKAAKAHGYPANLLGFADDGTHKLAIPDEDGRIVKFGAVGYGDFILWTDAEAKGEVPPGYAKKKRDTFHKSHKAIKGDWKKNPFSPNNLALKILW